MYTFCTICTYYEGLKRITLICFKNSSSSSTFQSSSASEAGAKLLKLKEQLPQSFFFPKLHITGPRHTLQTSCPPARDRVSISILRCSHSMLNCCPTPPSSVFVGYQYNMTSSTAVLLICTVRVWMFETSYSFGLT